MSNNYYIPINDEAGTTSSEMREIDRSRRVGIEEIGSTTNPFEHQTNALKARIFHGSSRVEFAFMGQGKGRKEQSTPETFGRRERQDMRELAEFNKVQTTTHATVGVGNLSGIQQGKFADEARENAINEVKRAIHFASEATTGGAVVFHTGEAPRYMYGRKYMKDKNGDPLFQQFADEKNRRTRFLVDPITKEFIQQVRDVDEIAVPKLRKKNGKIEFLKGINGKDKKDDLLKDYDKIFDGRIPEYETDENGNIQTEVINYKKFQDWIRDVYKAQGKPIPNDKEIVKDFSFMKQYLQIQYNLYFGKGSERQYIEFSKDREKLLKIYKEKKRIWDNASKEERKRMMVPSRGQYTQDLGAPDYISPLEQIEERLEDLDRRLTQSKEMALNGRRQAREVLKKLNNAEAAEDFAIKQFCESIAELGEYTWIKSEDAKKKYKEGVPQGIKNDLYLAPENLFPEMYGSHPHELRTLIKKGRNAMADRLVKMHGMSKKKADDLAEKHIKATFDIGHANMWFRYFRPKKGESLEQKRERFNKWLLKETKGLLKDGIIGHIHVSDNFGFHDEHLTAGDGNAPIKEFVELAKKEGFDEFIVESGSFNPMTSLPDTWMHFDSPVYNIHVPGFRPGTWTDPTIGPTSNGFNNFYRSYFGRTEGPRYLVGGMAPSEEFRGAPFYTGLGLE